MDCCKAISVAAGYGGNVWEDFWERPGIIDFEPLLLGVIVTIAGTGSECNGTAVITNEEQKVKCGRDYPQCNPKFALMDPAYTYSVPDFQMVLGGYAAMAENRILKLGKKTDFTCRQIVYQLGAYTNCNYGLGLAVLQPIYCRHIYRERLEKFKRFAIHVWGVQAEGNSDEEIAEAGIEALTGFIREIGLPSTLQELMTGKKTDLKEIANSCTVISRGYKRMAHQEILEILQECGME